MNHVFLSMTCNRKATLLLILTFTYDLEDENGIKSYAQGDPKEFWDYYIESECPFCFEESGYDYTEVHSVDEDDSDRKSLLVFESENQALRKRLSNLQTQSEKQKETLKKRIRKLEDENITLTKAYDRLSIENEKLSRKITRGV